MNEKYFVNLTKCGRSIITKKRELLFGSQRSASRTIGINQSIISDWERGRYRPTLSNFIEYLNCLKINPKFLDSSKLSNIVYFSPYEKDAPEIKKPKTYNFQSLDRNVLLIKRGRELLKRTRLKRFGSQQNASLICGLDQSCISYWESGKANPTFKRLMAYLKILGIPCNTFIKKYCSVSNERIIIKMIKAAKISNKNKIKRQGKLTLEKAYILGVIGPGDGYVGYDELELGVTDKEFAIEFKNYLEKTYGIEPSLYLREPVNPNHKPKYHVRLCSKAAVEDVKKYARRFKEYNWQLPRAIIKASEKIKYAYLRGIFDSQAHVSVNKKEIRMYLSNLKGLHKLKKLLKIIEIKSSVTDHNQILRICGRRNLELFSAKINFIINRKREALKELLGSYKRRENRF